MRTKKRGVRWRFPARSRHSISPIIATVLLIALVMIIALIIFLWARKFIGEAVEKEGVSAEQKCSEVNLEASVSDDELYLSNRGNVAVYGIEIRQEIDSSIESDRLDKIELGAGQSNIFTVIGIGSADSVKIVPILLGETKGVQREYVCDSIFIEVSAED